MLKNSELPTSRLGFLVAGTLADLRALPAQMCKSSG